MKKLLLTFLCTVSVLSANAESDFKVDLSTLDTNKFCVYDQSVYSLGSVVTMGKSERICRYIATTIYGVKPGARWEKL